MCSKILALGYSWAKVLYCPGSAGLLASFSGSGEFANFAPPRVGDRKSHLVAVEAHAPATRT